MNEESMSKLQQIAEKVAQGKGLCVIMVGGTNYGETVVAALSALVSPPHSFKGIYVSLNVGYERLCKNLEKSGIETSQLFFIDAVSKTAGKETRSSNVVYVSGAEALTEMSLSITEAVNKGSFDFLLVDSLNTLLLYNGLETVERFCHYLCNKLDSYKIGGLFFSSKESGKSEVLVQSLSQSCVVYNMFD